MRVAQIAPLYESVPPLKYGGTERVVSYLTEEMVRQGHEVTLFASGDSLTQASLHRASARSLRLSGKEGNSLISHMLMVEQVRKRADEFDILHFHIDFFQHPILRTVTTPAVTTLHGRLDIPELIPLYAEYSEAAVVSISDSQRRPLPWLNWQRTIYHGLPKDLYKFHKKSRGYAAFVGRISPEKRPDRAIQIAQRMGIPLKIAAKVDNADLDYYNTKIKPMIEKSRDVEFIGEIGDHEKNDFLGNAACLLFPIDWPEPFGLVMIEAMACGTPVVAYRHGSVPEIITHGKTGFIVDNVSDAVKYAERIHTLDRQSCRRHFEEHYTVEKMVKNYVDLYEDMIEERGTLSLNREQPSLAGRENWKTYSTTTMTSS